MPSPVGAEDTLDLAARSPAEVRGAKSTWAVLIAVNFIGPIAYLILGRRPMDPAA